MSDTKMKGMNRVYPLSIDLSLTKYELIVDFNISFKLRYFCHCL